MALLAADAARVLDDRGLRSAHVVGLSMGSAVALELAIRMPHRVKSMVLIGGAAGGPATVRPPLRAAVGVAGEVLADSAWHGRVWPAAAVFSERFRREQPQRVAEYIPYFGAHRAPAWTTAWQTLAVACFGRGGSLHRVRAPTLVLHGGQDAMTPVGNAVALADGIPGAELHVVDDAGHAVPLEHPEAAARLLLDWVRRHAAAEPVAPSRRAIVGERVMRPLALPAGTLRNTRDVAALLLRRR
jgi:pimeloyl-ACP methyl ester carboxylesterase